MLEIESAPYRLLIKDEPEYSLNSTDNLEFYQIEYYTNGDWYQWVSKHGIRVYENETEVRSAIICEYAGATTVHSQTAIAVQGLLFICCCDHVYCLSIPDLALVWRRRLDFATCFGIYLLKKNYSFMENWLCLQSAWRVMWNGSFREVIFLQVLMPSQRSG